ncbi:MAG: Uma2 family endonuclease [Cyanobacteria bacterium P01_G01_bin.54]
MNAVTLDLEPIFDLSDDRFYRLCQANPELRIERNSEGSLIILSPTGGETGNSNAELGADFVIWNRQTQLGKVFDSSTGFKLPNGATRSPDVAWVEQSRWDQLPPEQRRRFPPLAPDFVLELVSPTDSWADAQAKLQEYIANGVRLGWLIDLDNQRAEIYRPGQVVQTVSLPAQLSSGAVLPGFVLQVG